MYHYPNQPVYHHEPYQQCTPFDHQGKTENNQVSASNVYHSTSQNVATTHADTSAKTQSIVSERKISSESNVDTSNFSIEERLIAAVWVHERKRNKTSLSQIKHNFRQRFDRDPPAKNTLLVWERKLFSTGSVCDAPRPGRPINRRGHVEVVAASVRAAPALSLRARALALRLPRTTLRTILRHDLRNLRDLNDLPHGTAGAADAQARDKASGKQTVRKRTRKISIKPTVSTQLDSSRAPPPAPLAPPPYSHHLLAPSQTHGYT